MLKLHFAPNSRAGRILWLLEELELPYELNKMAFSPTDLKSDERRARHPLGRVPVLEDGDTQIWESGAITDYILEKHKNGGLKPSVDSEHFAKYLQWFHYCEGMVMPPMNTIDFSGADIMLGHSCFMSNRLGCVSDEMSNIKAYVEKLESRPAFKKAIETQ